MIFDSKSNMFKMSEADALSLIILLSDRIKEHHLLGEDSTAEGVPFTRVDGCNETSEMFTFKVED